MKQLATATALSSALSAALTAPALAGAAPISFELLVQTGDFVPGTNIAYTSLSRAEASGGNFAWRGDAPGATGIFARINGVDTAIARTGMPDPAGGVFTDASFNLALGKIDGDDVAFRANGIYAAFGGNAPQLIANTQTINPNTNTTYTSFQQPYISGGAVSFGNGSSAPQASTTIFESGTLNAAFRSTDPLPTPMVGSTTLVGNSVYSENTLALQVFDTNFRQGIVTNRGGAFNMIATGYENIPGKTFSYTQFLDPTIDGDTIGFIGWGPLGTGPGGIGSYRGIFIDDGASLGVAVETGDAAPGGGVFTDFGRGPSLFDSTVLFAAGVDGGSSLGGIYAIFDGELVTIADTSTVFDGKTPASFDVSQQSLYDVDKGTFLVNFADGSQANYTFHIIPAPGTLAALLLLPAASRRRRAAS
jgi:hypothetical protein